MHISQQKTGGNLTQNLGLKVLRALLFLGIFFLSFFQSAQGQNLVSVSFNNGAIGTKGNNAQDLRNLTKFQTLLVSKAYFIQNSSVSIFQEQGNDITGILRIITTTGNYVDVSGKMVWSSNGNPNTYMGFLPDPTINSFNLSTYGGANYIIDNTKNFALVLNNRSQSFTDGTDIGGNASSPLRDINDYLTTFNSVKPSGPVSVTSQTTVSLTPTINGGVTLRSGEALSIEFNGIVYTTGITFPTATTWSWTVPNTVTLTAGTYNVVATITNGDGYTLSDPSTNELVIRNDVNNLTIDPIANQTYTGSALTPAVVVKDGSTTLTSPTHYTAAYTNNINAGTATVTITGAGNYSGTKTQTFTIEGAAASKYLVTSSSSSPVAGATVTISAQLTDASNNAIATSGKTVTWSKSDVNGSFASATSTTNGSGIATVVFTTHTVSGTSTTITATDNTSLVGTTSTITTTAGAATAAAITTQPTGAASGSTLGTQPVIRIVDANGNTVTSPGVNVVASIASGTGTLSGTTTVATVNGVATFTNLVITGTAGNFTLTFTPTSLTAATSNTLAITAGAATQLAINAGNNQSATVGTSVSTAPSVIVRDANNNPVSGVSVTFAVATGGGSVTGATQTTGSNGIATVTSWLLGTTAGSNTVTATSGSLTGSPLTFTATGTAGAATAAAITTQPTGAASGSTLGTQPVIRIVDANGNTVTSPTVDVVASIASGTGTLSGTTTVATVNGVATFTNLVITGTAGNFTLTFTPTSLTAATSNALAITAGAATQLAINAGNNQSATVGTAVSTSLSVIVKDANNNPVSGVSVTFAVATGGGNATGTTQTTGSNGIATLSSWTLGTTAGSNTVTATSGSLTGSPLTFTATGTAGAATAAAITTQPTGAASGSTLGTQPVIRIVDANGNTVTSPGVNVVASIASGTGTLSGTTTVATVNGVATFTNLVITGTAGNFTLTFTPTSLTAATSNSLAITAGSASQLALTTSAAGSASGIAFTNQPVVEIRDAQNNVVTSSTATVTMSVSAGGTVVGTATATAVAGVATFTNVGITGTASTAYTLTFAATGLTSATQSITPTANTLTTSTINAIVNQTYTGSGLTPVVVVNDGNTTLTEGTNYTVAYTNNTNVGTATVTITGIGNYSGTKTQTFVIVAKAASSLTIDAIVNQTYTGSQLTPVVVVKDGNTTLTLGTHYTVAYSDNTDVGTATVTITGIGNYSGTKSQTFSIARPTVSIVSGNNQSGAVNQALADSPILKVSNPDGTPAANVSLTVTASAGQVNLPVLSNTSVNYTTGGFDLKETEWKAFIFTTRNSIIVSDKVSIVLNSMSGSPPLIQVEAALYTVVNGVPRVEVGTSGLQSFVLQGDRTWATLNFSTPIELNPATSYALVLKSNSIGVKWANVDPGQAPQSDLINFSSAIVTVNGGTSWSNSGVNNAFILSETANFASTKTISTNSNGTAALGSWVLGDRSGTQQLLVTNGNLLGSPLTITATATSVVPFAPTGLSYIPGNGQVTLAFTPGYDGGSVVTNYEYSLDNGSSWNALNPVDTSSPVTIIGLTNGVTYPVKIRAVNVAGQGAASAAISVNSVIPLTNQSITVDPIANQPFTGSALTPTAVVKDGNTTLTLGTDYTVAYSNNTNVGTATVTITGTGNYTGTKTQTFSIVAKSASTLTIEAIANQTYTGSALTPTAGVKDGSTTLTLGTDYTVAYTSNTNVGTATVTITGTGNYTGTKTQTFSIVAKAASTLTVDAIANQTYTGLALTPAAVVKDGSTTLTLGTDYIVAYTSNTNVGTATVTITGTGNYTGTKTQTFTIVAKAASTLTIEAIANQTYTGAALTPTVVVKDGITTLTVGTDYTVAYTSNTNVGTATVTITGTGNYTGTKTQTFSIVAKAASTLTVDAIANQTYSGSALTPTAVVKDGSTTLTLGTDYTIAYTSNTNVGTATVTITGIGNYTGTKVQNFTIGKASLSVRVVSVSKNVGQADPAYTVTYVGFVNNEAASSLTGALTFSRVAGELPGNYSITASGLTSTNYAITFVVGTLIINSIDSDNDGVLDTKEIEDKTDPKNPCSLVVEHQTESSGIQNWDSLDCDGDGVSNGNEIKSTLKNRASGVSFVSQDTDRDGIPDYLDTDDDGDGILTKSELPDRDGDGIPDDAVDTDGDGIPDYLDTDDDGDGILTKNELPDRDGDGIPDDAVDTDGDGIPDYLDTDDDGDGVLTKGEQPDRNGDGIPDDALDTDGDGIPDYLDTDDDSDGVPDNVENIEVTDPKDASDFKDSDGDGVPDYVELLQGTDPKDASNNKDTDGDGVPDYVERKDGTDPNNVKEFKNSNGDGIPDYIRQRSIQASVLQQVVLAWGTKNPVSFLPKEVEVGIFSGLKTKFQVVWNKTETLNILKRGTYELTGTLVLPKGYYNPYKVNGQVRVIVLPKPAPRDVTITNNTFVGSTTQFFISVGDFVVNDPVDNIHVVSFLGDGYDNTYFEIKNNILFWSSAERAPGKTTFSIVVRVTDRDGNTLDKFFTINRTRPAFDNLTIYNTFTPNGDRFNDTWGVPEIRFYEGARISVFDIVGTRMFYTENPDIRWDGTYNGKEMPVGSYFWTIEILETGERRRGMLNLIRK